MWTLHTAAAIVSTLGSPGDGFEAGISSNAIAMPAIALSGGSVEKAHWNRRQRFRVGRPFWSGGPPVWVGGCWRWRATHWGIGQVWSCW